MLTMGEQPAVFEPFPVFRICKFQGQLLLFLILRFIDESLKGVYFERKKHRIKTCE